MRARPASIKGRRSRTRGRSQCVLVTVYTFFCTSVLFVSCMYLDGGMGGGGWLLTCFFSIIYILGLVYAINILFMEYLLGLASECRC